MAGRLVSSGRMESIVCEILTQHLADGASIETAEPFEHLGLDSLRAVAFVKALSLRLDRALAPTLLWAYPNVAALAAFLENGAGQDSSGDQGGAGAPNDPI